MKTVSKILLLATFACLIPVVIHILDSMVFAYAVTGSFFGAPGYVPMAPTWAQWSFSGFVMMLAIDAGYLVINDFVTRNKE